MEVNLFNENNKGFTLIELLIAVSIFAAVAIALYSTFFAGISVWKRSSEGGNTYQDMKFVFDDVTKDLKNAIYCSSDGESIFAFSGTSDEIVCVTLGPIFSQDNIYQRELVKVAYRFDKETGCLIRMKAGIETGFDIGKAEEEVLLDRVEEFTFEYCYDSGDEDNPYVWKDVWEDEEMRLPRGIKIASFIKAVAEQEATKFSKIIFLPIGVLGEKEL